MLLLPFSATGILYGSTGFRRNTENAILAPSLKEDASIRDVCIITDLQKKARIASHSARANLQNIFGQEKSPLRGQVV